MRILMRGFVADGISANVSRKALLIENGRIIAVEKEIIGSAEADRQYEFRKEIIAPGFIDVHGHSDLSVLAFPDAFSKRSQGITTEIVGNCGLSAFPLTDQNRAHLENLYANYNCPLQWNDLPEYQHALETRKCALKIFSLCGHNTLRAAVAGYEKEQLNSAEIEKMKDLLLQSLHAGAVGLSTGLLYVPGCFAPPGELLELMKLLAAEDRVYTTHLRSEGDDLLESMEETFSMAERAGLKRVEISHFKTAGATNWQKIDAALELIEHFRRRGMMLHVDRYPYIESQTQLSVILPPPYDRMSDRKIETELSDPQKQLEVLDQLKAKDFAFWDRLRLTGTRCRKYAGNVGEKISALPPTPAEAVIRIIAEDAVNATVSAAGMSADNLKRILALPFCCCGSDGNALPQESKGNHPRAFGAMAKFIRTVLDNGLSLGKTIHRVTGMPAEFFRLPDAGRIAPGASAEITVFDPESIDSKADFLSAATPADGITLTLVNGQAAIYR